MTNELTSDMLTRIRNASCAKHSFVMVRYSKLNVEILNILEIEGYVKSYEIILFSNFPKFIKIFLCYKGWWVKKASFSTISKISKPGYRIFSGYKDFNKKINALKHKQGTAIISTSNGVMSHLSAIKIKKGGEILCYIE